MARQLPDSDFLDAALSETNAAMNASETHGLLCGMLCTSGRFDEQNWISYVIGEDEKGIVLSSELQTLLGELYHVTCEQIMDAEADFHLVLPGDSHPLSARTECLADWCQGFVLGLAAGGLKQDSPLPEDTAELITDFVEIARVGYTEDDEQNDPSSEEAYMQLEEYIRVGVLLIKEELTPTPAGKPLIH